MFQKRHFELIARILSDARNHSAESNRTVDAIAWQFANALRATNDRFDVERFVRASGVRGDVTVGHDTDPRD